MIRIATNGQDYSSLAESVEGIAAKDAISSVKRSRMEV